MKMPVSKEELELLIKIYGPDAPCPWDDLDELTLWHLQEFYDELTALSDE